jgi:hypothetical protein
MSFRVVADQTVEIDETFVGARSTNRHGFVKWMLRRKTKRIKYYCTKETHQAVLGIMQRDGKMKSMVISAETKKNVI